VIGETLAIAAAICWAASPIIYRKVLIGSDLVVANLVRAVPATILLVVFFLASGGFVTVLSLDLPNLLLIIVSVFTGQVVGDLLYFRSIVDLGASKSCAIFSTHPLFAMLFAFLLLNEPLAWNVLVGAFAIVGGLWLINLSIPGQSGGDSSKQRIRILKPIFGASLWGVSTFVLKIVLQTRGSLETVTLRMIMLSTLLLLTVIMSGKVATLKLLKGKDVYMLGSAGVIALALGNFLLYAALSLTQLSIAAPLSSISPLFTTLFAVAFLKEKLSSGQVLGIVSIFLGSLLLTVF
jgi:drug/metabolite transporter (DMT)-like permease